MRGGGGLEAATGSWARGPDGAGRRGGRQEAQRSRLRPAGRIPAMHVVPSPLATHLPLLPPPAREPHGAGCDSRHATYQVTPGEPSRHLTLSSHFGITACVPRAVLFIPVTIAQPPFVRLNPFLVFTRPQPSSHLAAIRLFSASLFLFYLFINSVLRMLHISHLVIIFV